MPMKNTLCYKCLLLLSALLITLPAGCYLYLATRPSLMTPDQSRPKAKS